MGSLLLSFVLVHTHILLPVVGNDFLWQLLLLLVVQGEPLSFLGEYDCVLIAHAFSEEIFLSAHILRIS